MSESFSGLRWNSSFGDQPLFGQIGTAFIIFMILFILNKVVILGFPLGFYMAAQGSLIIYVLILYYYANKMRKLDVEYGVDEGDL